MKYGRKIIIWTDINFTFSNPNWPLACCLFENINFSVNKYQKLFSSSTVVPHDAANYMFSWGSNDFYQVLIKDLSKNRRQFEFIKSALIIFRFLKKRKKVSFGCGFIYSFNNFTSLGTEVNLNFQVTRSEKQEYICSSPALKQLFYA